MGIDAEFIVIHLESQRSHATRTKLRALINPRYQCRTFRSTASLLIRAKIAQRSFINGDRHEMTRNRRQLLISFYWVWTPCTITSDGRRLRQKKSMASKKTRIAATIPRFRSQVTYGSIQGIALATCVSVEPCQSIIIHCLTYKGLLHDVYQDQGDHDCSRLAIFKVHLSL